MTSLARQWISCLVSLGLHLLVFAWVSQMAMRPVAIPSGVYKKGDPLLIEVGLSSPANSKSVFKTTVLPSADDSGNVTQSKQQTSSNQVSKSEVVRGEVGFKDGTDAEGELGHPNGYQTSARERYLFELHVLIEGRKVYPAASKRLRETGRVTVAFTVAKDGAIQNVALKIPSHFERLNNAAMELISGIKRYKPLPEGFDGNEARLEIPIEYSLN